MRATRSKPPLPGRVAALAAWPAALGVLALLSSCHAPEKGERGPTPVRVETVELSGEAGGIRYSCSIQPRKQVALAFQSGGYVVDVLRLKGPDGRKRLVQQGDLVTEGTVLARVREDDYRERVSQARAGLAEARSALQKASADLERATALFAGKSLTQPDLDAARAARGSAEARVSGATAQLAAAEIALGDAALKAPMDALVLSRNVEEGALAGPGTIGFVLADTTSVKAVFGVPDTVLPGLRLGDERSIAVEAIPGAAFEGRITAIASAADRQSRAFDVEVTIPNPGRRLKSGMIAIVTVPEARVGKPALSPTVALTAILKSPSDPGRYAVFVVSEEGGRTSARTRAVDLGEISGNRIVVKDGLKVGERVVVSGASFLSDGEAVRVMP